MDNPKNVLLLLMLLVLLLDNLAMTQKAATTATKATTTTTDLYRCEKSVIRWKAPSLRAHCSRVALHVVS